MNIKDLIRAGRLQEARNRIAEEVKASPSDAAKRTLLFQVLAFCGEWDKAERHLEILAERDPRAETGAQVYRNLITAEKKRDEVFQGTGRPSWMTRMPDWLEELFQAREKLSAGAPDEASAILRKIDGQTPAVSGVVDGRPSGNSGTRMISSPISWRYSSMIPISGFPSVLSGRYPSRSRRANWTCSGYPRGLPRRKGWPWAVISRCSIRIPAAPMTTGCGWEG
jgi:hypothetical protein